MQHRFLLGLGLVLAGIIGGVLTSGLTSANPSGLFVNNQSCQSDGTISASLNWTPDSSGQQFVDLTGRNDNFSSAHSTGGPFNISLTRANLTRLSPNTTYYARVRTQVGGQFLPSSTLAFTTISCTGGGGGSSNVSAPTHLQGAAISATSARFQWVPGNGNRFFCLDFALNTADLLTRSGTWRNSGCGNISNSHVVSGLSCGTTYVARVWTSAGGGLYSGQTQVTTRPCASAISPPTNVRVLSESRTTAFVDWSPGADNRWYCVDTAETRSDLLEFEDTWRNHSCWTTASQATIGGLRCDTTYHLRVYAWNVIANVHSGIITFQTDDCDGDLVEAPIDDVDVDQVGDDYHAEITARLPNDCHSFASYQVNRSGNVVNITVLNAVSDDNDCDEEDDTYDLTVNLGDNFTDGVTYTVIVNDDESDTFTAS